MSGTATSTAAMMLEELRQRIRQEYAPPPASAADRLATFGRGVLSNRGSFLDNLTAGLSSQEQAAAARADQQRRALDMERQVTEQAVREQLERDRLAQSQSQFEAQAPEREARTGLTQAQTDQARALAEYYRQGGRGGGAGGARGQLGERDLANLVLRAEQRAATEIPDPRPNSPEAAADTPAAAEARRVRREQRAQALFAAALEAAGRTPAPGSTAGAPDVRAAPVPTAIIDVRGNPTR